MLIYFLSFFFKCSVCQCRPIAHLWLVMYNQSSCMRKHLVIGFSLFFIGHHCFLCVSLVWVVHLPERTKTDLITVSDQTVQAAHNYNNCFFYYAPEGTSGGIFKSNRPSVCPSVRQSVRPLQIVSQRYLINY